MFVHINKKVNFTDELKSKYVDSIVFIKDSQEIWTHDTFYAIPDEYKNRIEKLEQKAGESIIFLTQEEYDLLGTNIKKDIIYIITNDTPELKIQGPFIANAGLLEEVDTIENYKHYVFKVNNEYFFIYKNEFDISLPDDSSLFKKITGNFKILQTEQGNYEYCVPEIVDVASLDDTSMESLLKDIVIVDSFKSYGSESMNYNQGGFYSLPNSEFGTFYGFYVNSIPTNISLRSDKIISRYKNGRDGYINYRFPNTLCTYSIGTNNNIIVQQCLNNNNSDFHKYLQNQFADFKNACNIEEVEFIKKSNSTYEKELDAISEKIGWDLNTRLDFGTDADIIVGRIVKFKSQYLNHYIDVSNPRPNSGNEGIGTISPTNNVYWLNNNDNYLVLVSRSDKIIPEPPSAVKLKVKNDLTTLKYDSTKNCNYFPVSVENIEEFNDDDVSGFLSNIIVPAVDGIDKEDSHRQFISYATNPWLNYSPMPKQDVNIQSSNLFTGLKIGKGNPDFTYTYEYRFSEYRSTFTDVVGTQYKEFYSPIMVPGDVECKDYEYSIDQNIEPYVSEVLSKGKYKRLIYNTTIGFNCPSYIIPSLYYYLHLGLKVYNNIVIDSVELIAPSNCKYDTFIKAIEAYYNIDLSNRFSYDEGTISNYMLLYIKTKEMN